MRGIWGLVAVGLLFSACAATELNRHARFVRLTRQEPKGCKYLGEATGNQGNFFTGRWTSNSNMEAGARNALKNEAAEMGGNVVVMMTDRAGQTASLDKYGGRAEQTNVTMTGTVFDCPNDETAM